MAEYRSVLGVDLRLIDPKNAQERIIKSCAKCWFERNANGYNWGDCSGFVKAVQQDLGMRSFVGQANDIFNEVVERPDWIVLGSGSQALAVAGAAANGGALVVGVWKNPAKGKNGHVAIITSYLAMLGHKPEHHALGAWGQLQKVGRILDQMSLSFGKDKYAEIRYARCLSPISRR